MDGTLLPVEWIFLGIAEAIEISVPPFLGEKCFRPGRAGFSVR